MSRSDAATASAATGPSAPTGRAAVTGSSVAPRPLPLERIVRAGITALGTLPAPVIRALTRRRTVVDGQTLEREVQLALSVLHRVEGPTFESLPLAQGRRQIDVEAWQFGGRLETVHAVRDLDVPGPDGPIPCRLYLPEPVGATPPPLVVYLHGGGFVLGSLASHDPIARFLCATAQVAVLNVGYRLAPEHPFPAAHEDAIAAYAWAREQAAELGAAGRIAVVGDSAGGNLAAAICLAARERGIDLPDLQVLLSPWLDLASTRPSRTHFADGYFLTASQLDWYTDRLLGRVDAAGTSTGAETATPTDPAVSPLHARDLAGLPPTYLAYAGFDPLRDESAEFAERLRAAGVPVVERCHRGHVHPFSNVLGVGRTGRAAAHEIAAAVRSGLDVRS